MTSALPRAPAVFNSVSHSNEVRPRRPATTAARATRLAPAAPGLLRQPPGRGSRAACCQSLLAPQRLPTRPPPAAQRLPARAPSAAPQSANMILATAGMLFMPLTFVAGVYGMNCEQPRSVQLSSAAAAAPLGARPAASASPACGRAPGALGPRPAALHGVVLPLRSPVPRPTCPPPPPTANRRRPNRRRNRRANRRPVEYIPELHWQNGYGYFWGVCIALLIVSTAMLVWAEIMKPPRLFQRAPRAAERLLRRLLRPLRRLLRGRRARRGWR